MRALVVGTDFSYDSNGNLKPIEMNTSIGYSINMVESSNEIYNLNELQTFIQNNNFIKVYFIAPEVLSVLKEKLVELCNNLSIEFEHIYVIETAITVPYIEDNENILILRTSYDTTAIIDDTYCRDKVKFLNLIKNTNFGSQFAYIDENNNLVNSITNIPNNGIHPNFILKAVLPNYDIETYPKLYKVTNQTELNVILQNVTSDYFLMEYYLNDNFLFNGLVTKLRKTSVLLPPDLQSIHIGSYTDLANVKIKQNITYDSQTYELDSTFRDIYITNRRSFTKPKLMDDDYVVLADGTRKSGLDLQIGDILKTIDIPNPNNMDETNPIVNYGINLDTFISGTTYSTNAVTKKMRIESYTPVVTINFTDGTNWMDTIGSSYLIYNNDEIKFKFIDEMVNGDIILLIDTNDLQTVQVVQKTVDNIVKSREIFEGWLIEVERRHLFLTATSGPNNISPSFVAIEHNVACKNKSQCDPYTQECCYKGECAVCKVY